MTTREQLALGMREHESGNLQAAETVYRNILASQPQDPDALHLLGVALHQTNRHQEAVEYIQRAISINPEWAPFYGNLGNVLSSLGRLEEAVASYRRAVQLMPEFPEAYSNLGNALREQGKFDEAVTSCQQALQIKPDFAVAHNNLGNALKEQGRLAEAVACYNRALQLQPDYVQVHNNLGTALKDLGKLNEAIVCYQRALQLMPGYSNAHSNLGSIFRDQGRLEEAVVSLERALQLRPDSVKALNNLGNALKDLARFDKAIACYEKALSIKPDYAEAHNGLGMLRLLLGDLENGWPEYEWRVKLRTISFRQFQEPRWDGAPAADKTVLIHAEQGLGDTLQFVRYAGLVKQRVGQVVLLCQKAIHPLMSSADGVDVLVTDDGELPPFDMQVSLLSLPGVFRTTVNKIPAQVPYISPKAELIERWQGKLKEIDGFRIGISWQGNPEYPADRYRSIPLAHFTRLAEHPEVRLISLQKSHGVEQLNQVRRQVDILDLGRDFDESSGPFMDTAAVMKNLDLFITSDTATAHLAGTLGVNVWVALPLVPDWRWLLDREDCPWYPTMRLFRQRRRDDWEEVFRRIQTALCELVSQAKTDATAGLT